MTLARPLAAFLFILASAAAAAAAGPDLRLLKTVTLGGEGGWDGLALDPGSRRLFIARGDRVQVLDADRLKPAGEIPRVPGASSILVSPELGRGFASASRGARVVVFDPKTLKTLGSLPAGRGTGPLALDPGSRRLAAFNAGSRDATILDAGADLSTGAVVATVPLGGKASAALADGRGRIYATLADSGELVAVDAASATVAGRWPLSGCSSPQGLAADGAGGLLASCGGGRLAVVSSTFGVVAILPVADHAAGIAVDAAAGRAFVVSPEGSLAIAARGADGWRIERTLETRKGARHLAWDAKTGRLFAASAELGAASAPTAADPYPRPTAVPGTFAVLVYGR